MKILFSLPLVLLFILGVVKNPKHFERLNTYSAPPIVLSTTLEDTLPAKTIKALGLNHVSGIKIQYLTGFYASYFEYEADRHELLKSLSQLPFYIGDDATDTMCNPVAIQELDLIKRKASATELDIATAFWNVNRTDLEIYDCIKPPFRHTILTSKNSNRILHRVEFLG